MTFSFEDKPDTVELLEDAYDIAIASTDTYGKYAQAYDLLFALISVDSSNNEIIEEEDVSSIDLETWSLSSYNTSGWQPAPGVDEGAWIFLRGVSQVNLGPDYPGGETDYSKFIREYTKEQYRTRFGADYKTPSQLETLVQQASDAIAQSILKPTVCSSVASRNLLLYQSLPSSIPDRHAILWRRKDDLGVGTTASGIVEWLHRFSSRVRIHC